MLMTLSPESCFPVLLAYELITYKNVCIDVCNGTLQCDFTDTHSSNHTC